MFSCRQAQKTRKIRASTVQRNTKKPEESSLKEKSDMGMTEIAKAYVQLVPSAQGIKGKITSAMNGEAKSAGEESGKTFSSSFGSTVKKAILALGIGAAIGKVFNASADLQQNLGGTEAVFGEFASTIQATATEAYKNMGMSASDYMATANKMGSLFQGSGLAQVESLTLTAQAMQRAADVASVMGISTESAMEAITGAAKGNFTMMDNLGVKMDATTLEAYALEKGMKDFSYSASSNAQKAQLAIQMFMETTSQYEGNFARESEETLSGSLNAMKSIATDLIGNLGLGKSITPQLEALAQTTGTFLKDNLAPMLLNIAQGMPQVVSSLTSSIIEFVPRLIPVGVEIVKAIGSGIKTGAGQLLATAGDLITNLNSGIGETDWTGIGQTIGEKAITAFEGLSNAAYDFMHTNLVPLMSGIADAVPEIIAGLISAIIDNLPQLLTAGGELVIALAEGMVTAAGELLKAVFDLINQLVQKFKETDWESLGTNIVEGIKSGLSGAFSGLIAKAKEVALGAWNAAKEALGIASPSKKFAELGKYSVQGFMEGFDDNSDIVQKTMQRMTAAATDSLNTGMLRANTALSVYASPMTVEPNNTDIIRAVNSMASEVTRAISAVNKTVENKRTDFSLNGRALLEEINTLNRISGPSFSGG